ncbi:6240_t:CDS:2, partial [Racocetra fulgida]
MWRRSLEILEFSRFFDLIRFENDLQFILKEESNKEVHSSNDCLEGKKYIPNGHNLPLANGHNLPLANGHNLPLAN